MLGNLDNNLHFIITLRKHNFRVCVKQHLAKVKVRNTIPWQTGLQMSFKLAVERT